MTCPPLSFRNSVTIDDPLDRALEFVRRDWSYRDYDLAPVEQDDRLTAEDIAVANKIVARMSASVQAAVLERAPLINRALAKIPPAATLCAPEAEIEWDALGELYQTMWRIPEVGLPRATKILHKKRPALIPILDSVVEGYLRAVDPIPRGAFDTVGVALTRSYRVELERNGNTIACVRSSLATRGINLTECRILDMFTWAFSGVYDPWNRKPGAPVAANRGAATRTVVQLSTPSDVALFVDDENGYRAWLYAHPSGFVLNTDRRPRAAYLILHRATCETIAPTPDRIWTGSYIKFCSDRREALEAWAKEKVGTWPRSCAQCEP